MNWEDKTGCGMSWGDVAIIGMACVFPKAPNLRTFWKNIVSKVDAITDSPKDRGLDLVFDPDSQENDRISCQRGGYLQELPSFNPLQFGIMPTSIDGSEPEHFLALQVAHDALQDAGYPEKPLNKGKTEVILGRGTFVNRGYVTLLQHGFILDQTIRLLKELNPSLTPYEMKAIKDKLKAQLPPFTAQTAPGLAHSVMAGIIANRLDLQGPHMVVDAACASSLIALETGMHHLLTGQSDAALIGGVQVSTPAVIHMLFTQLGALSRQDHLRPFDKDADGTMLSEGIGMMVLKRLQDAVRDGHRIYAVIKGIGSSSDGRAKGLLAPRLEGEELALRRAYESCGISPSAVGLIEAHGTALPLGDITEVEALRRVFGSRDGRVPRCALGTVKSMIGHLIPAAGIAGLIKAALSLYYKVLPPTLHCDTPNPKFELEKTPFYINTETRPWIHGNRKAPRRAGVNAFGFGGINVHAVLEEFVADQESERVSYHTEWDTELCLLRGQSRQDLVEYCKKVQDYLLVEREVSLTDLAFTLSTMEIRDAHCLAIVASSIEDLRAKLAHAIKRLEDLERSQIKDRSGIYFFEEPLGRQGRIAFVFPGEGSQYVNMLSDLCVHFPEVRECFDLLDRAYADRPGDGDCLPSEFIFPPPGEPLAEAEERIFQMDGAVDAVITGDRAIFRLLRRLGVAPDVILGHSSGEIMALEAAGAVDLRGDEELLEHIRAGNRMIQSLQDSDNIPQGALLAVGGLNLEAINQIITKSGGGIWVSMDNCPNQFVVFGSQEAIDDASYELRKNGAICQPLTFGRAYHTPLFEPVLDRLQEFFNRLKVVSPSVPLYSCMTTGLFPVDPAEIRRIAVAQWARPVRFRETIEAMYNDGIRIFLEVGPRGNLTGFINDILKGKAFLAVASNVHHRSGVAQLNHTLGLLAAHGVPMQTGLLYRRRGAKELSLESSGVPAIDQNNKKGTTALELSLPILSFGKEEPRNFGVNQQGTAMTCPAGNEDKGDFERDVFLTVNGNADLLKSKIDSQTMHKGSLVEVEMADASTLRGTLAEEYFRTMESFLEVQEQVMLNYLDSEKHGSPQKGKTSVLPFHGYEKGTDPKGGQQGVAREPLALFSSQNSSDSNYIKKHANRPRIAVSSGSVPLLRDRDYIQEILLATVSEKTGYPTDIIDLHQDLEADLGIDSIKRVEILGQVVQQLGSLKEDTLERVRTLKTLDQIVSLLVDVCGCIDSTGLWVGRENSKSTPKQAQSGDQEDRAFPFGGEVSLAVPKGEMLLTRVLDLKDDLFLRDHSLGGAVSKEDPTLLGLPVLPLSMSLEAMAEGAARILPGKVLVGMKNILVHQWIVLDPGPLTIEIRGKISPEADSEVEVQLMVGSGNEARLGVEGIMVFRESYPQSFKGHSFHLEGEIAPPLSQDQYYPYALFHGPLLQTIKSINRWGSNGIEAILEVPPREGLFRDQTNPHFVSDPVVLDGAGQAVGLWAGGTLDEGFVVFPVAINEIRFYEPPAPPGSCLLCEVRIATDGDTIIQSHIDMLGRDGAIQISLNGLRHKRIRMPKVFHLFRGSRNVMLSTPWLAPVREFRDTVDMTCCKLDQIQFDFWETDGRIWRTALANIALSRQEREVWQNLSFSEKRRTEWLLARVAGKDAVRMLVKEQEGITLWPADIEILPDQKGRPMVSGAWTRRINGVPHLSLAHSQGLAIAVAADGKSHCRVGVDVEYLRPLGDGTRKLAYSEEESALIERFAQASSNEWFLRIWCAKEALAKAIGRGLPWGPRDFAVRHIDIKTGLVELLISERRVREGQRLTGSKFQIYTICESGVIVAAVLLKGGEIDEFGNNYQEFQTRRTFG